jgi:hypothetical protein
MIDRPSNPPSDDDAFAAVTGKAQLANAIGVEPSSLVAVAVPPTPSRAATAEVPHPQEPTSSPVIADKAGETLDPPSGVSSAADLKPGCLSPDTCKVHFTSALCSRCNDAWERSRAGAA